MGELFVRVWDHVGDRIMGPLHVRFVLQPAMAIVVGIRAGLRDASATERRGVTAGRAAWEDIAAVWAIACGLDTVYQIAMFRWVYPGEALLIASLLALVPYLLVRGSVARIARRRRRS